LPASWRTPLRVRGRNRSRGRAPRLAARQIG
jgi:hypothetical protein